MINQSTRMKSYNEEGDWSKLLESFPTRIFSPQLLKDQIMTFFGNTGIQKINIMKRRIQFVLEIVLQRLLRNVLLVDPWSKGSSLLLVFPLNITWKPDLSTHWVFSTECQDTKDTICHLKKKSVYDISIKSWCKHICIKAKRGWACALL